MTAWRVGRATITPVVEVESVTSPRFLFKDLDKAGVLDIAQRSPWLQGAYVDDGGYLLQRIQCLVVDLDGVRIAVDTCVGNDKPRANPGWNELHLPFLTDLEAAGFPPDTIDAVVCTHLHVDHVGWNTMLVDGQWVPTFPNARYLLAQPEFEYWQATVLPDGDDYFSDSVAPLGEAGVVDLVPVNHAVDSSVRFDSTPGHTPGHVSVVVESAGERAVITGDMLRGTHPPHSTPMTVRLLSSTRFSGTFAMPPGNPMTRKRPSKRRARNAGSDTSPPATS